MDPYTALMIGQSVVGYFEAEAQASRDEARFQQNRQNAAVARDLKIQSLNSRAIQEAEATAGKKFDLAIATMEAKAARTVAAGEAGLSGRTINAQKQMVTARQLRGETVLNNNLRMTLDQIEDEKEGFNTEMLNRINSLPRGVKPNILAHALSTAASAYAAEASVTGKNLFTGAPIGGATNPMAVSSATMPAVGSASTANVANIAAGTATPASVYAYITGMPKI